MPNRRHLMYPGSYSRTGPGGGTWLVIVLAVVVLGALIGSCSASYYKEGSVHVTVNDKESVSTNNGHEYRVYTNHGTFVMKDSIIKGRFRTGDEYGAIKRNHTYDCKTIGWRVPFFSMFKNLLKCKEA